MTVPAFEPKSPPPGHGPGALSLEQRQAPPPFPIPPTGSLEQRQAQIARGAALSRQPDEGGPAAAASALLALDIFILGRDLNRAEDDLDRARATIDALRTRQRRIAQTCDALTATLKTEARP